MTKYYSDYYQWLLSRISADPISTDPYSNYQTLLEELYSIPYTWTHELDRNREIAGLQLREEFAYNSGFDQSGMEQTPCSVLEMLIALAEYMAEIYGYTLSKWFWEMISNMKLDHFTDGNCNVNQVDGMVNRWLQGNYTRSGDGTPFPLRRFDVDTRRIQLFDMLSAYVNENYPIDEHWLDE